MTNSLSLWHAQPVVMRARNPTPGTLNTNPKPHKTVTARFCRAFEDHVLSLSLTPTHSHTHSLSLTLSLTRTHTHFLSLSLSDTHKHTNSLSLSRLPDGGGASAARPPLSLSHLYTDTHTYTHTHIHTYTHTHIHTYTHTHIHTYTHTHAHTHTHTHTHSVCERACVWVRERESV